MTNIKSKIDSILHESKVIVDKKCAEKAAYTAIITVPESSIILDKVVYDTFVVNKNFGYIIFASSGVILFFGIVSKI